MTDTHTALIEPVNVADIEEIGALARYIWLRDYREMISLAQIEYMLAQRYAPEVMRAELATGDIWWRKLSVHAQILGFSACLLTDRADELKLDKLYVHSEHQRHGYGGLLIDNAVELARSFGKHYLILAVNKTNTRAIGAYRKYRFEVRESIVKDIGDGFVMDDFIMVKEVEK